MKSDDERWALVMLERIIARSNADRDALPGKVVQKVKEARVILKKRLRGK